MSAVDTGAVGHGHDPTDVVVGVAPYGIQLPHESLPTLLAETSPVRLGGGAGEVLAASPALLLLYLPVLVVREPAGRVETATDAGAARESVARLAGEGSVSVISAVCGHAQVVRRAIIRLHALLIQIELGKHGKPN